MPVLKKSINDVVIYGFLIVIGCIYYIYRPDFLIEAEDARGYALAVMGQTENWAPNPHHLIFEYVHMAVYKIAALFGYSGDVYGLMQTTTILFSVGALAVVYNVARTLNFSLIYTFLTLSLTAFSFSYWTYSSEADTYLIPFFFAILNLPFLLRYFKGKTPEKMMVLMGLTSAVATLITQQYVLLLPIIAITIFLSWFAKEGRKNPLQMIADIAIFGMTATFMIIAAYAFVCFVVLDHKSAAEAIGWIRGLTSDGLWTEFSWWKSPVMAGMGVSRSFWGLNYLFAYSELLNMVAPLLPGSSLVEEHYAAVKTTHPLELVLYFAMTIIGILALIFMVFKLLAGTFTRQFTPSKTERSASVPFLAFAGVYLAVFFLFAFLWEPENIEFLLHMIPVFWLVAFYFLSRVDGQKTVKAAAIILAVTAFSINFFGSIKPYSDEQNDYWNYANYDILNTAAKGDLIIVECGAHCERHIKFKTDADIIRMNLELDNSMSPVEAALRQPRTGRIFISKWMIFPELGHPFPHSIAPHKAKTDAFYASLQGRLIEIETQSQSDMSTLIKAWPVQEFWEYIPQYSYSQLR